MSTDRVIVLVLILAGALLPVVGAVLAWLRGRETLSRYERDALLEKQLRRDWGEAERAHGLEVDAGRSPAWSVDEWNERYVAFFAHHGLVAPTYSSVDATGVATIAKVLRHLGDGQGWNVALVVLGVISSTVAAVWSLWLPPA